MGISESRPISSWSPSAMYDNPAQYEEDVRHRLRDDDVPGLGFDRHSTRYPDHMALLYNRPADDPRNKSAAYRRQLRAQRMQQEIIRLEKRATHEALNPGRPLPGATAAHMRRRAQEVQMQLEQAKKTAREHSRQRSQHRQQGNHLERRLSSRMSTSTNNTAETLVASGTAVAPELEMTTESVLSNPRVEEQLPTYEEATIATSLSMAGNVPFAVTSSSAPPARGRRSHVTSNTPPLYGSQASVAVGHRKPVQREQLTNEALQRQEHVMVLNSQRPLLRRSTYSLISEFEQDQRHIRDRNNQRQARNVLER